MLALLFPYRFPDDDPGRNLSRYACVEDYHQAGGRVLRALAEDLAILWPGRAFEPFLDNSPLPEVYAAALCGLGVVGDNGLLIHPRYGSYVFIGTIVTDAPLPPDRRRRGRLPPLRGLRRRLSRRVSAGRRAGQLPVGPEPEEGRADAGGGGDAPAGRAGLGL